MRVALIAPAAAGRTPARSRRNRMLSDSVTLAARSITLTMRRPDAMLTALLMPILLMVVFGYLFSGAIHIATGYVTYLVPGIVLTCVVLGSSTTAVSVNTDMAKGVIDRFRTLNVGGPAFLSGHVSASTVRSAATVALVFAVAFPMGARFQAGWLGWLGAAGIILLLILAVSWLSAVGGLLVRSPEAASSFTFFMMLVPFTSSAFVPVATMPSWLHGFVSRQPATLIIESLRSSLRHHSPGNYAWESAAWCGGIVLISLAISSLIFQRRTA
ncbi:MAG TPA: ABC transporter permease [Streptosporangiaceae bacterium]|jgi:ABC-2 type transport system permease protein